MNTTATLTFGQLNWNISRSASNTLESVTNAFNSTGVLFEITVIVFFIANFFNKNSYFRRPYYVIYTIGCIVNALQKFPTFVNQYIFFGNIVYYYVMPPVNWYNENFIYLCNLVLALNRFSAIIFPFNFSKTWSKRNSTLICIGILVYPFLIHCFNPLPIYYKFTRQILPKNLGETPFEYYFGFASSIAYAIFATLFGCIAALYLIIKKKMKDKNIEKVLLAQSITSSIFLVFSTVSSWFASINKYTSNVTDMPEITRLISLQQFFLSLSKLFYSFHHYIGLILLLIMSKKFRTQYLNFYKISYVFGHCRHKITPQPNMTTTVITLTNRANSF